MRYRHTTRRTDIVFTVLWALVAFLWWYRAATATKDVGLCIFAASLLTFAAILRGSRIR